MATRSDPSVSEAADAIERAISEGMLLGALSRSWGGQSGAATREGFVVSEGEETVVVSLNPDTKHLEVKSLYASDKLGRLGQEVQDRLSQGHLL